MTRAALLSLPFILACGGKSADSAAPAAEFDPQSVESAGPWPVSSTTLSFTEPSTGRSLDVEVWYPAQSGGQSDVLDFLATREDRQSAYAALLDAAPAGCPSTQTNAARDAAPADDAFPLLVFSHCHGCVRFSAFTVAERLASHGFIVAAPGHEGDSLWDTLDGQEGTLDAPMREMRATDIIAVADALIAGELAVPGLTLSSDQLGVFGHSFGGATTAEVLVRDGRFMAGLSMAAPMENPLMPGISAADVQQPVMMLLAQEDNSITELGNQLIRRDFDAVSGPVWLSEVVDAGHWSFSDVCGLTESLTPGCGSATRQTAPGEDFDYLAPATGREIAAAHTTAFFLGHIADEPVALEYLDMARPEGMIEASKR